MTTITIAGVDVDTRHWIGGQRVASAETFDDVSPDRRTAARPGRARRQGRGRRRRRGGPRRLPRVGARWARTSGARSCYRVADAVEAHIEELAQIETRDNGSLLRSHRRGVMPRVAMNIRFFADYADRTSSAIRTSRRAATPTTCPGTRPASP